MRHVDHQHGADLVGDLAHLGEVDPAGVGRVAGHEHQRLELPRLRGDDVVVEQPGLRVGAVLLLVEHLAADVGPEAVGQVTARVERHPEQALVAELVAQLLPVGLGELVDVLRAELLQGGRLDPVGQDRPEGDQVGVDARVRLRIGVRRPEQLARVLGGERLDGVDVLAGGVEAVTDRALGVLVAEPGAHRQQHRRRGVVLRGDQLQRGALVGELLACGLRHTGLHRGDHLERRVVRRGGGLGQRSRVCLPRLKLPILGSSRPSWPQTRGPPRRARPAPIRVSKSWTPVSRHEIRVCGTGVRNLRLVPMISADTTTWLVARRHVDLGRTRSMMCHRRF